MMSEANVREIPGYYYDKEKKKYFKIQKTQHAPPGAKYTREAVKQEQLKERKAEKEAAERRKKRIRAATILASPLGGGIGILREHGDLRKYDHQSVASHAYIQGLSALDALEFDPWNGVEEISTFAHDHLSDGLIMGMKTRNHHLVASILPRQPSESIRTESTEDSLHKSLTYKYDSRQYISLTALHSPIVSVNISRQRNLIAASSGGDRPPMVYLSRLLDEEDIDGHVPLDYSGAACLTPSENATIYCTAAYPFEGSSEDMFAVGMSSTASIMRTAHGTWHSCIAFKTPSNVMSLEYQTPWTLALGLRDATVHIWDIRTTSGVARLRHDSSVIGIKRGREAYSLIISGIKNSMSHYDLRMVRDDVPTMDANARSASSTKRKRKRGKPPMKPKPTSKPLFHFDYSNEYHNHIGFDVDTELGLVAAAQDDGSIGMYSVETGEVFRWVGDEVKMSDDGKVVVASSLRFTTDARGRKAVMASRGNGVVEYAW